jgi:hypothetical protein
MLGVEVYWFVNIADPEVEAPRSRVYGPFASYDKAAEWCNSNNYHTNRIYSRVVEPGEGI